MNAESTDRRGWLLPPRAPTKEMWRRLKATRGSLMREMMNIELEGIELFGRVLDVGGGESASYVSLLAGSTDITSINIDPELRPTVVGDLSDPLPFPDAHFATVISFNTLEHLADDQFALSEMVRVLQPGGKLHIIVPFLHRVHGHPFDFHRHTADGWNLMIQRAGIPSSHQGIRPMVWDPMSTAWALIDTAPLGRNWWRARRVLRPWVLRRPLVMRPIDRRMTGSASEVVAEFPLAYIIEAQVPEISAAAELRVEERS